jgi:hypothetical protein
MNNYNVFTNKNKKNSSPSNFFFREDSFPSLTKEDASNSNTEIKKSVSYVDKLNFCQEDENKTQDKYNLKPGCILITRDKNNKIITFKNEVIQPLENKDKKTLRFSDEVRRDLKPMFDRWDKYKSNFIELYGEHDYYYYHTFPNYNYDYLNSSDSEAEDSVFTDIDNDNRNNFDIDDDIKM